MKHHEPSVFRLARHFSIGPSFVAFGLAALVILLCAQGPARSAEGDITFNSPNVRLVFQTPIAAVSGSRSLGQEISLLNLMVNLLENYLQYLSKMGKIAPETKIQIQYSPRGEDTLVTKNQVFLDSLGPNALLEKVNQFLKRDPRTARSALLDSGPSLLSIRDQLPRREDTFEAQLGFQNLSGRLVSLQPEQEFALIGNREAVCIRPDLGEKANMLVRLSRDGSGTVMISRGTGLFENLEAHRDGRYLAFSEGDALKVTDLVASRTSEVFPEGKKTVLDMAWSPRGCFLAGVVVDKFSADREIFIYDASGSQLLDLPGKQSGIEGDYQFAYPFWAPDGRKLFFTDGERIHLIDLSSRKVIPAVFEVAGGMAPPRAIGEILWAPDSMSFAIVEVLGQARDKAEFDDRDFWGSVLRRFRLNPVGQAVEDLEQTYVSSETLKLVGFWNLDRVLFLEGRLRGQRVPSALWDLKPVFAAHLTPTSPPPGSPPDQSIGIIDIPIDYCFVLRNLDGKFKNVYDEGLGKWNLGYDTRMMNFWIIGVKPPPGYPSWNETYNLRQSPFPFQERNQVLFPACPAEKVRSLVKVVESYNLRSLEFSPDLSTVFFLSNSRGPLTLWAGDLEKFADVAVPETQASAEGSEGEGAGEPSEMTEEKLNSIPTAATRGVAENASPPAVPAGTVLGLPDLPFGSTPGGKSASQPAIPRGTLMGLPDTPFGPPPRKK